ncbi:MAG: Rossmann-like and DUF2520 domain-containing protein [Candidatus Dormibacteria bacterium]
MSRPTLSFIGAGRAASALAVATRDAGYDIAAVFSRQREHADRLSELVGADAVSSAFKAVTAADITIVAVPDEAVPGVGATLAANGAVLAGRALVHTAARLSAGALAAARLTGIATGVLHPLQALTGPESADLLRGAAFRVDAHGHLHDELEALVGALGGHVISIPPDALDAYHAAAVLAGNAPLALLAAAERVLEGVGLDADSAHAALAALLHGAATNAMRVAPADALTGPVVRGDASAIAAHLGALSGDAAVLELYRTLARETARLAGRDVAALGIEPPAQPSPSRRVA